MFGHHRPANKTLEMAFRWRADCGLLFVLFWILPPLILKKPVNTVVPPLAKLLDLRKGVGTMASSIASDKPVHLHSLTRADPACKLNMSRDM